MYGHWVREAEWASSGQHLRLLGNESTRAQLGAALWQRLPGCSYYLAYKTLPETCVLHVF